MPDRIDLHAVPDSVPNDVPIGILNDLGIGGVTDVTPQPGGWGGTMLWRVWRREHPTALLLRIFPAGQRDVATREEIAHRLAARSGVPVPDVIASGVSGSCSVLLLTWCPGQTVADHLRNAPDRVDRIGEACGETLARIHGISVSSDEFHGVDWISRAGPYAERLRPLLEGACAGIPQNRLLHMDYHPENILVQNDIDAVSSAVSAAVSQAVSPVVTAVIDWANVCIGPPPADLARSRSILRILEFHPDVPADARPMLQQFERGFMNEYSRLCGTDPHANAFDAWAWAMQVSDLGSKIGQPGVWITADQFDVLRHECNRRVESL